MIGGLVSHVFSIRNTGNEALDVLDVKVSCGCTTTGQWSRSLAPGETGEIPLSLNTAKLNGRVVKAVTITTSDPVAPRFTLHLAADVWSPIEATPRYATFGTVVNPSEHAERVIAIRGNNISDFELKDPRIVGAGFKVRIKPVRKGQEYELVVTLPEDLKYGPNSATITIPTSSGLMPELSVIAHAMRLPPVEANPAVLLIPGSVLGQPLKRRIVISTATSDNVTLSKPICSIEGVDLKLTKDSTSPRHILEVEFPAGHVLQRDGESVILIPTNHPGFPELRIPISPASGGSAVAMRTIAEPKLAVKLPANGGVGIEHPESSILSFPAPAHFFGTIVEGRRYPFSFEFLNSGDNALEIAQVTPSCQCIQVSEWSRSVEPGGRGRISLLLDTKDKHGSLHESLHIVSNASGAAPTLLEVRADVTGNLEVSPSFAAFGIVARDSEVVRTVRIVNHGDEALELGQPSGAGERFATSLKELTPGKEFELTIRTLPPMPFGITRSEIKISTGDPQTPEILVVAHATVVKPVSISPERIVLPPGPLKTPAKRVVVLRCNLERRLELSSPEVEGADIPVTMEEVGGGALHRIRVDFPVGFDISGRKAVTIRVSTGLPEIPFLEIPVVNPNG